MVKADSYSAHADSSKLLRWVAQLKKKPKVVLLNHGEARPMKEFADFIHIKTGLNVIVPRFGKRFIYA